MELGVGLETLYQITESNAKWNRTKNLESYSKTILRPKKTSSGENKPRMNHKKHFDEIKRTKEIVQLRSDYSRRITNLNIIDSSHEEKLRDKMVEESGNGKYRNNEQNKHQKIIKRHGTRSTNLNSRKRNRTNIRDEK